MPGDKWLCAVFVPCALHWRPKANTNHWKRLQQGHSCLVTAAEVWHPPGTGQVHCRKLFPPKNLPLDSPWQHCSWWWPPSSHKSSQQRAVFLFCTCCHKFHRPLLFEEYPLPQHSGAQTDHAIKAFNIRSSEVLCWWSHRVLVWACSDLIWRTGGDRRGCKLLSCSTQGHQAASKVAGRSNAGEPLLHTRTPAQKPCFI